MTSSTTPLREAVSFPAAELDRRFYAFVIDRLLAWGLFAGAGYLAWRLFLEDDEVAAGVGVVAGTVVVVSLLFAVLLGLAGVSPGKALVGLRVVRHDDGRPLGVPSAVVRTAVLGFFTLPTLGLGLATLAWTAVMDPAGRRRGGHDRITGSVVVDVRPAPEEVVADDRPRQIVNLTAMRLMPSSAVPPASSPATPAPPTPAPPTPAPPTPAPRPQPAAAPPSSPPTGRPGPAPAVPPAVRQPPRPPSPPTSRPSSPPPAPPSAASGTPAPDDPLRAATVHRQPADPAGAAGWRVSFDTGEAFVVEGLALVGRRPEPRPGEPVKHVVPLRSSDMSLSKTHAQFQVVPDGALVVMDRGSTNGSVVVRGGVAKSLTAGRPSTLLDGDVVRFGDRTMRVEKVPAG